MAAKAAGTPSAEQAVDQPNQEAPPKEEPPKKSLLSTIVQGKRHGPPRLFVYGVHGIGKSTFAASAPSPVFIPTEDGSDEIDVPKFPPVHSRVEVMDILRTLYKEPHDYQTVVLDSADWFEDYILAELREEYSDKDLAYGKESLYAEAKMSDVLNAFSLLRSKRSLAIIVIAHSEIKRFDSPLTEPYDRYQPKLSHRLSSLFQEWADVVAFTNYDVDVKKTDAGFGRDVRRGISSGERMMFVEERPGYYAKNRYGMPPELALNWAEFAKYIPYYQQGE